jgi:hypothetical protein
VVRRRSEEPQEGDALEKEVSMTGEDLIEARKRRSERSVYFTSEGYDFVKDLKSAREICIALRACGVADACETDSLAVLVDKLSEAMAGGGRSLLSGIAPARCELYYG